MAAEENAGVEAGIGDVEAGAEAGAGAEIGEKNVPGQVPGWPKPQRITGPRLERQLALVALSDTQHPCNSSKIAATHMLESSNNIDILSTSENDGSGHRFGF
ncbi:predicted protein [Histoplasma capsulatum var. duboisii H88]|uniref:Predicted protein n=1 Tax=Ajellomyces capsulatus (strain H88) TaxID=544711 RepID=F0UK66_AJEC8|nr:predicted protein [Histoplasma capsulatum var. duboisii H88]